MAAKVNKRTFAPDPHNLAGIEAFDSWRESNTPIPAKVGLSWKSLSEIIIPPQTKQLKFNASRNLQGQRGLVNSLD